MKNKKTFTEDFTAKIAKLSKLDLSEKEINFFTKQFNDTLSIIDNLKKVKTKGIKEAFNITGLKNVFREDKIDQKRILTQEEALSNAKRTHKGYFVVKGIFDDK